VSRTPARVQLVPNMPSAAPGSPRVAWRSAAPAAVRRSRPQSSRHAVLLSAAGVGARDLRLDLARRPCERATARGRVTMHGSAISDAGGASLTPSARTTASRHERRPSLRPRIPRALLHLARSDIPSRNRLAAPGRRKRQRVPPVSRPWRDEGAAWRPLGQLRAREGPYQEPQLASS
jgi:hypothetical protein